MKCFLFALSALSVLLLAACEKNGSDQKEPAKEATEILPASSRPVYISPNVGRSILKKALEQTFTNQVPLADAEVAFFGTSDDETACADFVEDGGFAFFCDLNDEFRQSQAKEGSLLGGVPFYDNDTSDEDVENMMLHGYDNCGNTFSIPWPFDVNICEDPDTPATSDTGSTTPVEGDPDPENPEDYEDPSEFSLPEYDENLIRKHLGELVSWLDDGNHLASQATPSDDASLSANEDVMDLNLLGERHHFSCPVSINAYIDKAASSDPDYLYKKGEIIGDIEITPLYASSANDASDAGDYYIVRMDLTAKNGTMWGPITHNHGGCNIRIIGFYLEKINLIASITDQNGNELPVVRFKPSDGSPVPASNMGSSSYQETKSYGFSAGISSIGLNGGTRKGMLTFTATFNASWSKTTTRSIEDMQVTLNTPDNEVNYILDVHNINNGRDWDNVGKDIATHYPEICRSDMNFTCSWVWFIPSAYNSSVGVKDDSETKFNFNFKMQPQYGVYSWWRGASWSSRKHFIPNAKKMEIDDETTISDKSFNWMYIGDIKMPAAVRKRFGYIELTNMSSTYTLSSIRIIPVDVKDADWEDISGAINQNQSMDIALAEGKYNLEYTFINPQDNTGIATYYVNNITVTQGRTKSESTVKIASTDGEKK